MILADENIDEQLIGAIRAIGIEVQSIAKTNKGIADSQIIELARIPPRIILTEDKDFGEWVFAHGVKDVSIVLLRYKFSDFERITKVLLTLLKNQLPELRGKFTVVTVDKIRTRSLPG